MLKKLKSAKGAVSIFVLIMMVFLVPFAIFVGIELPKMHELNQRVKDAVDSAAASAVTSAETVNQDNMRVKFNRIKGEQSARQIFALKLGLKFNATGQIYADEESFVEYIEGDMPYVTFYDSEDEDNPNFENSTVTVKATVTFKNIGVLGRDVTVTQTGMSEARFAQ